MARFKLDPSFEREIMRSAEMRDILEDAVEDAADLASDLAPDDPATGSPDLPSSLAGEVELTANGYRGRVVAHDWKAAWYEAGADGVPAQPFLRPAVEETIGPIEPAPDGD